jgi:hypothetical protein
MTKPLPFTAAGLARAIRCVEQAGRHVVGVRPADGMLLVSTEPLDTLSLVPKVEQTVEASKWEDAQ